MPNPTSVNHPRRRSSFNSLPSETIKTPVTMTRVPASLRRLPRVRDRIRLEQLRARTEGRNNQSVVAESVPLDDMEYFSLATSVSGKIADADETLPPLSGPNTEECLEALAPQAVPGEADLSHISPSLPTRSMPTKSPGVQRASGAFKSSMSRSFVSPELKESARPPTIDALTGNQRIETAQTTPETLDRTCSLQALPLNVQPLVVRRVHSPATDAKILAPDPQSAVPITSNASKLVIRLSCWMSDPRIRALRLWDVTLPGSHNTASWRLDSDGKKRWGGVAFAFVKLYVHCQEATVYQQLQLGVRFLDLRVCKHLGRQGEPYCAHGGFRTVALREVLQQVASFCEKHPSEVIVLSVRRDVAYLHGPASLSVLESDFWVAIVLKSFLGPQLGGNTTVGDLADRKQNVIYFFEEKERYLPPCADSGHISGETPALPQLDLDSDGSISTHTTSSSPTSQRSSIHSSQVSSRRSSRKSSCRSSRKSSRHSSITLSCECGKGSEQERSNMDMETDSCVTKDMATAQEVVDYKNDNQDTKGLWKSPNGTELAECIKEAASLKAEAVRTGQSLSTAMQHLSAPRRHIVATHISRGSRVPKCNDNSLHRPLVTCDADKKANYFEEVNGVLGLPSQGKCGEVDPEQKFSRNHDDEDKEILGTGSAEDNEEGLESVESLPKHLMTKWIQRNVPKFWISKLESLPAPVYGEFLSTLQSMDTLSNTGTTIDSERTEGHYRRKCARNAEVDSDTDAGTLNVACESPGAASVRQRLQAQHLIASYTHARQRTPRLAASLAATLRAKNNKKPLAQRDISLRSMGSDTEARVVQENNALSDDDTRRKSKEKLLPMRSFSLPRQLGSHYRQEILGAPEGLGEKKKSIPRGRGLLCKPEGNKLRHKKKQQKDKSITHKHQMCSQDLVGSTEVPRDLTNTKHTTPSDALAPEVVLPTLGECFPSPPSEPLLENPSSLSGSQHLTEGESPLSSASSNSALSSAPSSGGRSGIVAIPVAVAMGQLLGEKPPRSVEDALRSTGVEPDDINLKDNIALAETGSPEANGIDEETAEMRSFLRSAAPLSDSPHPRVPCKENGEKQASKQVDSILNPTQRSERLSQTEGKSDSTNPQKSFTLHNRPRPQRRRSSIFNGRRVIRLQRGDVLDPDEQREGLYLANMRQPDQVFATGSAVSHQYLSKLHDGSAARQSLRDMASNILTPFMAGRTRILKSWSSTCDPKPKPLCKKLVYWSVQHGETRPHKPFVLKILAGEVTPPSFGSPETSIEVIRFWTVQGAAALCFRNGGLKSAAIETHKLLLSEVLTRVVTGRVNGVTHDFVNETIVARLVKLNLLAALGPKALQELRSACKTHPSSQAI